MVVCNRKLCVVLLLYIVSSSVILREVHEILPFDNLLKTIAKTIERYEKGEIPRSTTIYFHLDNDDGQQTKRICFTQGL